MCHQYWPNERSMRYMYFIVEPITEYNMSQYILREFKVTDARDGQSRTVRQFHFIGRISLFLILNLEDA